MKRRILSLLIFFFCHSFTSDTLYAYGDWYVSLYGARASDNRLLDILGTEYRFVNSYIAVISLGKTFWGYEDYVQLEAEGQIAKHFHLQSHMEVNGALILRWRPFPWDHYLDTSFAVGDGLSYASEKPVLEQAGGTEKTTRVLNYLVLEFAFASPQNASWDVFTRIHHRSGIYGLFDDVEEGSNMVGMGLRYYF